MNIAWEHRFADRTKILMSSAIREILKFTLIPDLISFAGGLPSPDVFPIDRFKEASNRVLEQNGKLALQYSITEGYVPLREFIIGLIAQQGVTTELENIILTNGSQQGLDLIGKIFINRGDKVLVEAPSYLGAIQAWNTYGASYIPVETDEHGILPDALEKAMRVSPKFAYILPNFQNPTGKTLPLDRRLEILDICERFGVPIIEDDPYEKLRYLGESIPSLMSLDVKRLKQEGTTYNGNVIYTSTFSKVLAPGLRLAWVVAPKTVIQKLVYAKQGTDLHTSTFVQLLAHEITKDNFLDEQIQVIRKAYGKRRNIMLETIEEFFPTEARWTRPEGGLFLWVSLPEKLNTETMLKRAVEQKVAYVPGSPFYPRGGGTNTMRLNFSNASEDEIVEGMKRLSKVIKEELVA